MPKSRPFPACVVCVSSVQSLSLWDVEEAGGVTFLVCGREMGGLALLAW